jgi:hypothetical protein
MSRIAAISFGLVAGLGLPGSLRGAVLVVTAACVVVVVAAAQQTIP